jgi:hypothetical protein
MGMIFAFGPGEVLNTENVVVCAFLVMDKQDIEVTKLKEMEVTVKNQKTGEEETHTVGAVGVHGMTPGERMDVVNDLIRELFKDQKR